MMTEIQSRNQIIRRISRIPKDKLKELDEYVSKLEHEISRKNKTLSFAGAWQDMDESVFEDLTKKLISKRQKNRSRIDEQDAH